MKCKIKITLINLFLIKKTFSINTLKTIKNRLKDQLAYHQVVVKSYHQVVVKLKANKLIYLLFCRFKRKIYAKLNVTKTIKEYFGYK
jgi:hypothetical protein